MNLSRSIVEGGSNKFLVSSKDPFLISEFIEKIRTIFNDYEYKMCVDIEDFLELYHRGDIFSSDPMIIYLWELTADAVKELAPIVSLPTKDILIFTERKILSKTKAYTSFTAECSPVKLSPLNEKECLRWVSARMRSMGLKFERDVPKILIDKKSSDLYALDSEIRKLKVLYGNKEIDKSFSNYIAESSDAKIFEFMEHLFHKRRGQAIQEFYKFSEDYYVKLVHTLIGNIEKIYKIASYRSQKRDAEEIAELTSISKFIIKTKYFTILSVYGKTKLLKLMDIFNDLDYQLRLSPLPKKLIFEAYLIKALNI